MKNYLKQYSFFWYIFTASQLKYKFNALNKGVAKNKNHPNEIFNLRRNIHRLEKGLTYPVLKKTFALDYIYSTVETLAELIENNLIDPETEIWSKSVLIQYFEKIDLTNETVKKAKVKFDTLSINREINYDNFPYDISQRHKSNIDYNSLFDLALQRRSVRNFLNKKIDINVLDKAFDIAKLSPSACNRQSFRYLYYDDPKTVKLLSSVPGGISGFDLYNLIVIVGDYGGYFNERDINAPVIDASLAAMSFLFACETLGLATVCVNWPNLVDREKNIRKIINIKETEFVIMMIGVGYPDIKGKIPYSRKRGNKNFLEINQRIK